MHWSTEKSQRASTGVQGNWLYRGLDGLSFAGFMDGDGFTEKALMSTTRSLDVAMEYSGAKMDAPGSVLVMETAEVDHGAPLRIPRSVRARK